jgi:hypothetical protein
VQPDHTAKRDGLTDQLAGADERANGRAAIKSRDTDANPSSVDPVCVECVAVHIQQISEQCTGRNSS